MNKGSTQTGTYPKRRTRTLQSVRISQLMIMPNATQHWEEAWVPRLSKDNEKKTLTKECSTFIYRRAQITKYWKEEGFGYLDQELLMCEMVYSAICRHQ